MAKWKPEYFESKVKPNGNLGQKRFISNSIDNKKENVVKNNNLKTTKHSQKNSTYQTNGKNTLVTYGEFLEKVKLTVPNENNPENFLNYFLSNHYQIYKPKEQEYHVDRLEFFEECWKHLYRDYKKRHLIEFKEGALLNFKV
mgnify:CR=1 FL=1